MITLEKYLENPCKSLSIPYWKAKKISIPEGMKIVHDSEFDASDLAEFFDEKYFRISHDMKNIYGASTKGFVLKTAKTSDFSVIAEIINVSYDDIKISEGALEKLTETPVYDGNLWLIAEKKETERPVACAIADFDSEAKELIIEWVQVLPEFRRKGIGKALVNEILSRMKEKAAFATVSGRVESESNPERLYCACGFKGNDIWHIMRRK